MFLFNGYRTKFRSSLAALMLGSALTLTGCTVQPLYQGNDKAAPKLAPTIRSKLAAVAIDAPNDRFSQIVRNRLIFLLDGGKGEPPAPQYMLTLNAGYSIRAAVQIDIGDTADRTGRASKGTVVATSKYLLKDKDGKLLASKIRTVSSSFDRPRQEYANLQAEEDGEKRAAEELAEQIFLSVAQDLSKLISSL